ncbi:Uncharacterised protein [Mycobacteroides abscessus]|uniref:Uncharacterized protein n=1 Tax=Mycobacteroides abscessus TaxID=36809 RepID=A0AB33T4S2_9MYCO|nr:Uncharacterised protein [Mycobacteroides abscessus]CPT67942.1 Uncharacterised protein [Mycobacteroides abscessus]CPT69178.1 Uncharacterised protein [Mycobacteroides abscessus]CPV12694.1 Uncharacterised protein [Mycobacteroides abscessus]CPV59511.1 Uncharacterised protein [Mycobacteroides abscessus]
MSRSTVIRGSLNPVTDLKVSSGHAEGRGMCLRTRDLVFCPSEPTAETVPMLNPALKASLKVPLNRAIRADSATPAVRAHRGRFDPATVAVSDVSAGQHT